MGFRQNSKVIPDPAIWESWAGSVSELAAGFQVAPGLGAMFLNGQPLHVFWLIGAAGTERGDVVNLMAWA